MAEALKHAFSAIWVRRIGAMLRAADSSFPERRFVREASAGLEALELLERGRHVARAMARALPESFEDAARIVESSLGPPLERGDGNAMAPFIYLPHVVFVAERGADSFETSMRLQHALTQRFSCEMSIRTFLARWPDETFARLHEWTRDPSVHVRRLVSEGTRSRLPWAMRVPGLVGEPRVVALLDRLKDDPELYVRRSVANNLNDIAKDDPSACVAVCERWSDDASRERRALIRHALRWLVKRGDARALALVGADVPDGVMASGGVSPRRLRWGEVATATIDVRNEAPQPRRVVVDLVVRYVKADGSARPKVFKVAEVTLAPGQRARLSKRVSFVDRSTRKHYPGVHAFEAMISGACTPIGAVTLGLPPARPGSSTLRPIRGPRPSVEVALHIEIDDRSRWRTR